MSSLALRQLEARGPAAYAVRRAQIQALEAEGWTFREPSDGFVAELDGRRGVYGFTLDELVKRIARDDTPRPERSRP